MDATLQDPLVGRVLDGRYRVQSRIARGGMATVYLALDGRLDREVALKVMHGHLAQDAEFVARFVREARSAARLSHPNVVQVFDQGADGDVLYLAMEHLPGRTLRDVLADQGALTPREALAVLDPLLDALSAAHRAGIVHRDVKPENVLLTDDGRVKVADFGLARAATTTATTGTLIGTVAYLSPELVARGIADARSDVYACGILLFEMLTGRPPFIGEVPIQVAFQHVHEQVPPPSDLVPELPEAIDDVVLAATAQDPDERPDDAGDMLHQVRTARSLVPDAELDHRPVVVRPAVADPVRSDRAGPPWTGPATGPGETEVVDRLQVISATQALPGLDGPAGRALDLRPPGRTTDLLELDAAIGTAVMRRRRRRGAVLLTLLLLVAGGLGAGAWWWFEGPGSFVTTPAVAQVPIADATAAIEARGLVADAVEVFDDTVAAGLVVTTDPQGGADIRRGGTVALTVSKGPELFAVPKLVGATQEAAEKAIGATELALGEVTGRYDEGVKKGVVLTSTPAEGAKVRRGTPVNLVVSKGPEPIPVPDVVGSSLAAATETLTGARLEVTSTTRVSESVAKGDVISQDPDSGSLLPGQTVELVVSSGPPLVEVPSTFRMSFAQARRVLEAAGFQVQRRGTRIFDQVFATEPAAGAKIPKGSTVIVRTF